MIQVYECDWKKNELSVPSWWAWSNLHGEANEIRPPRTGRASERSLCCDGRQLCNLRLTGERATTKERRRRVIRASQLSGKLGCQGDPRVAMAKKANQSADCKEAFARDPLPVGPMAAATCRGVASSLPLDNPSTHHDKEKLPCPVCEGRWVLEWRRGPAHSGSDAVASVVQVVAHNIEERDVAIQRVSGAPWVKKLKHLRAGAQRLQEPRQSCGRKSGKGKGGQGVLQLGGWKGGLR